MKIRKGDQVKIISGNDKGKSGKVLAVFPKDNTVLVDGVNVKKKHVRPRQQGKKGELVRIPMPFPVSRTMLSCPKCGKPVRPVFLAKDGLKHRSCRKCGVDF